MKTENLSTLKIHKLTQAQYERELAAGRIDANALYLTPDEDIDLSNYVTKDELDAKADENHNHDDAYYTETEIDTKLASKSDTTHKHDSLYDSKGSADIALDSAKSYTDTKTSGLASTTVVDNKISTHNASTSAHNDIRDLISGLTTRLNTLANSDDTTLDQMGEVVAYIKNNKSLIDGITTSKVNVSDIVNNLTTNASNKPLSAAQGVAIKGLIDALQAELDSHTHAIADVSGLQSALDGKAASSHGTHVSYSSTKPVMDGTASVGSASTVARSDHKHPTDTSRVAQSDFDTHVADATKHITSTERTNWGTAYTHSQAAHAPSNAQANQNAFSNIAVSGQTTVAADTTTDTVTFIGSNVSITTDATNDKVTFSVADGSTSAKGVVKLENSTSSTSTTTAATPSSVKSAYDLANTAKTNAATAQSKADSAYTLASGKVGSLSDLSITATATELNYMDGVTSNVQAQLDGKAASGHTHNYAGSSSAGGAATSANKINTDAGSATNPVYFSNGIPVQTTYTLEANVPSGAKFTDTVYTHPNYVTKASGLYKVSVDDTGHISGATVVGKSDITALGIPAQDTTYSAATTSAAGLMSAADKAKLDNTNVSYGTCSTAADVAAKVVNLSGNANWKLAVGSIIMVSFTNSNTASNVTLNVNNTGAYPIWYNASEYTSNGNAYTGYAGRVTTYMFNGTHWVWVSNSYDANTQSNTNSTDTSSKIYLVGATSQGSNKTTYSHDTVYAGTDGHVYSNGKQVVNLSDTQNLTNKTYNGNKIMTSANVIAAVKTITFESGVGTYTNNAITTSSVVFAQWRAGAVGTLNDSVLATYPQNGYMTIISKSGNSSAMPVLILIINP